MDGKRAACLSAGVELLAATSSSLSSLLQHLIPSSREVLAGPGGRQGSFIPLGGSESFFRSCKSSLRLLKCVVLKAVREPILNGGDTKMSGAFFTASGNNLRVCWNCLSQSLPSCCKSLPGFDEKHIYAEIHGLSHFFSAFSATLFRAPGSALCSEPCTLSWCAVVLHARLARSACAVCTCVPAVLSEAARRCVWHK